MKLRPIHATAKFEQLLFTAADADLAYDVQYPGGHVRPFMPQAAGNFSLWSTRSRGHIFHAYTAAVKFGETAACR
jgi:hypothetical protein